MGRFQRALKVFFCFFIIVSSVQATSFTKLFENCTDIAQCTDQCACVQQDKASPNEECRNDAGFLDYESFYYCTLGGHRLLALLLMVVWMSVIVYMLYSITSHFLLPNFFRVITNFRISSQLTAVVILSIGSTTATIWLMIPMSLHFSPSLSLSSSLGSAVMVISGVIGLSVLLSKNTENLRMEKYSFLSHYIFFLISLILISVLYFFGCNISEAVFMLISGILIEIFVYAIGILFFNHKPNPSFSSSSSDNNIHDNELYNLIDMQGSNWDNILYDTENEVENNSNNPNEYIDNDLINDIVNEEDRDIEDIINSSPTSSPKKSSPSINNSSNNNDNHSSPRNEDEGDDDFFDALNHSLDEDRTSSSSSSSSSSGCLLIDLKNEYFGDYIKWFKTHLAWDQKDIKEKIKFLYLAPIKLIENLTIPQTLYWAKPFVIFHPITCPLFIFFVYNLYGVSVTIIEGLNIPLWPLILIIGGLISVIIALSTSLSRPPIFFRIYGILGILMSSIWLYFLSIEFISTSRTIARIFGLSEEFIGVILISLTNSAVIGISNIFVGQKGGALTQISIVSSFLSPSLGLLLGLGISFIISIMRSEIVEIIFPISKIILANFAFLYLLLLAHFCFIVLISRLSVPPKFYAIALLLSNLLFFVVCIVLELTD